MPATSTCCRSSGACSGTGWPTRACGPRRRSCSACTASATSRAGRSPAAISSSCAVGRPSRSPRSPATTTRTSGRSRWLLAHLADRLRRPGRAGRGATRRPRRPRPRVRPRAPAPRGARLPRRGRGPADRCSTVGRRRPSSAAAAASDADDVPWWSPRRPADFGGRQRPRVDRVRGPPSGAALAAPWTTERIAVDRAHLLRRLGRTTDAADAWAALAAGPGRIAVVAAIELAKIREHRLRDRRGALDAVMRGLDAVERRRRLGRPEPALEADLCAARSGCGGGSARGSRREVAGRRGDRQLSIGPDLRDLARDDRPADALPGAPDEDGRAIRDRAQPGTFDRERSGRGREPQVRRPPRPVPPDDRRPQDRCEQRREERVAGAGRVGLPIRGGRQVAERLALGPSSPTRIRSPPRSPSVTSRSAPGWRSPVSVATLVPAPTS